MSFSVEPASISAYAGVLDAQSEHNTRAAEYVHEHVQVSSGSNGVIIDAENANPGFLDIMAHSLDRATEFLTELSASMDDTARMYKNTDIEAAAQLDSTYAPIGPPGFGAGEVTVSGAPTEREDPTSLLVPPDPVGEFDIGPFAELGNVTSVSWWINALIKEEFDVDIMNKAVEWLVCDWQAFARAANGCVNLAEYSKSVFVNYSEWRSMTTHWSGNAANAAYEYLGATSQIFYAEPTNQTCSPPDRNAPETDPMVQGGEIVLNFHFLFTELGKKYSELAVAASNTTQSVNAVLGNIADMAIWGMISAAVGAVTSWSLVAGGIGAAITGMALTSIGNDILTVIGLVNQLTAAVQSFSILDIDAGSPLDALGALEMPLIFHHPAA
ncbi:type VII secretion target [Sciscionella marina]|uniref:type VII secretion target n=1 Tax=Sciscionella marina TaxID=508770 RepID=UPI000365E16B|nr:type VII secretion target [Sciscionella marina]